MIAVYNSINLDLAARLRKFNHRHFCHALLMIDCMPGFTGPSRQFFITLGRLDLAFIRVKRLTVNALLNLFNLFFYWARELLLFWRRLTLLSKNLDWDFIGKACQNHE